MRPDVKVFALAAALTVGFGLLVAAWRSILCDGATAQAIFIGCACRGRSITPLGSVIGRSWGLVDRPITDTVFARLDNLLSAAARAAARPQEHPAGPELRRAS